MLKFVYLQFKRVLKLLPKVLVICVLLFIGMLIVFQGISTVFTPGDQQSKIQIAICGEIDHPFLELGISAIQAFDSSKYTMELQLFEEEEAKRALQAGTISAYVVIPEGFMDAAVAGRMIPLKYVGSVTSVGVSSIFKDEITRAVSHIVEACQNGMLASHKVAEEQGMPELAYTYMDDISIEYLQYVLVRSAVYEVEELGVTDPLGFQGYLVSGISVVFLLLLLLPFGMLYIRSDLSLDRLMCSKRHSQIGLVLGEFVSLLLGVLAVAVLLIGLIFAIGPALGLDMGAVSLEGLLSLLPVLFCLCAMSYLLFNVSGSIVGGMLLQFVVDVAMCFISGCMYPIYFFPESVRKLAFIFPTTYARQTLAGFLTGQVNGSNALALCGFGAMFLVLATYVRYHRTHQIRG